MLISNIHTQHNGNTFIKNIKENEDILYDTCLYMKKNTAINIPTSI